MLARALAEAHARAEAHADVESRTRFARAFCTATVTAFWRTGVAATRPDWPVRTPVAEDTTTDNRLPATIAALLQPVADGAATSLHALAALLNAPALDRAFRCISGSVAVSAYELHNLPLPAPEAMRQIERAATAGASADEIDAIVAAHYAEVGKDHESDATRSSPGRHRQMVA